MVRDFYWRRKASECGFYLVLYFIWRKVKLGINELEIMSQNKGVTCALSKKIYLTVFKIKFWVRKVKSINPIQILCIIVII